MAGQAFDTSADMRSILCQNSFWPCVQSAAPRAEGLIAKMQWCSEILCQYVLEPNSRSNRASAASGAAEVGAAALAAVARSGCRKRHFE